MTRTHRPDPVGAPFSVPDHPPVDWFDAPTWLEPDEALVITDDGRVGARLFQHGLPLIGNRRNFKPAPSATGFAAFHSGTIVAADGNSVKVGSLRLGHAGLGLDANEAGDYYADVTRRCAVVRAGVDDHGVWLAGVLVDPQRPQTAGPPRFDAHGLRAGDVATMRASAVSGDWRPMAGEWWEAHGHAASLATRELELVGVGLVNAPALPKPGTSGRPRLTATAALIQADETRGDALADVLRCSASLSGAHEAARVATLAVVRPDPNAWRTRARCASIAQRAGLPWRPPPEGLTERLALLNAQKRVRGAQARLDRSLERLAAADLATSLQLVDVDESTVPRADLTVAR